MVGNMECMCSWQGKQHLSYPWNLVLSLLLLGNSMSPNGRPKSCSGVSKLPWQQKTKSWQWCWRKDEVRGPTFLTSAGIWTELNLQLTGKSDESCSALAMRSRMRFFLRSTFLYRLKVGRSSQQKGGIRCLDICVVWQFDVLFSVYSWWSHRCWFSSYQPECFSQHTQSNCMGTKTAPRMYTRSQVSHASGEVPFVGFVFQASWMVQAQLPSLWYVTIWWNR